MFEDDYKAVNDAFAPSAEAEQRTLASMRRGRDRSAKKTIGTSVGLRTVIAACLCLLVAAPAVIGVVAPTVRRSPAAQTADPTEHAGSLPAAVPAEDYSEVFEWLRPSLSASYKEEEHRYLEYEGVNLDGAVSGYVRKQYAREPVGAPTSDHSDTNVQVAGVDESDIVKTDGRYIYVLNDEGVTVLKADGAKTHAVAHIPEKEMPLHNEDAGRYFCGMYLADGRLIVIAQEYKHMPLYYERQIPEDADTETDGGEPAIIGDCYYCFNWFSGDTMVYVFDIGNAEKPERISALCMEGSFTDSRLTDGRLYVITSYQPDPEVYPDEPASFIPGCFDNEGKLELTPAADIARMGEGRSYTYIAALNVSKPSAFTETLALLGQTNTVYCSGTSIYLTVTENEEERTKVRFFIDDDYECVIDPNGDQEGEHVIWHEKTGICRISLAGGKPVVAAQGSVDGYCLNQFSLDEYEGHLRIAVTKSDYGYITQQLGDGGETCYNYSQEEQNSAVCVLNSDLVTVGRLEGLARDEMIKSVRFMGDIGYVVTFRQTDPLFSIDLSVPSSPKVIGKLKIPGFSEYLHSWGEGLLFGFGQMADIETGGTEGIKLSMFDVSDPTDVKERACLHIKDIDYSAAEYDHKAILAAPERGLIGFPADSDSYAIYTYGEDGFKEKARIKLDRSDWSGAEGKGLYIGSCFYVIGVSGTVSVIDLNSFKLTATVEF